MFKLAYAHSEFDGTIGNNHPNAAAGVSPGNRGKLGGYDTEVYSVGLTLLPIDRLEIDLGYFRTDIVREPAGSYALQGAASNLFGLTNFNDLNCLPRSIAPGVTRNTAWCGELPYERPQAAGDTRLPGIVVDPRQLGLNGSSAIRTATARYDITEQVELFYEFGRADYSGIGGGPSDRDPVKGSNVQFLVGSPVPVFRNVVDSRPNGNLQANSHELRLQSAASDRLSWLAGAYYSEVSEYTTGISLYVQPLGTASLAADLRGSNLSASRFEDRIRAVYGSIDYRVTDAFVVAVEARRNDEDKKIFRLTSSTGAPVVNTPASPQNTFQARNFTGTTWRGTVSWQPRESLLAYVSAAKGEKAGGFNNARNPDLQGSFNPETNITWELGVKSEWLDGRLRLNGAVYAIDWSDIQGAAPQRGPGIVPTDPNVIENRGGAESTGLELELGYAFTDSFGATLAASFNDPRYTNATFLASTVSCDGSLCTNGAIVNGAGNNNIDGNSLERQSKTSASLLLSYSGERAGFGVYSNLDFNYQSKQYLEALNLGTTGSRMLANAKLGVTRGPWDVSLWSKNLFDEKYVANSFVIFFANSYVVGLGEGRQIGLTARYKL
jgi:outer membrane receptor protein involved in Fe transport